MDLSHQYFLIVAEEQSITQAAKRLFVSQQCISIHIKKLEQMYNAELFQRRPIFKLTPEGQALRKTLLRQRVLDDALAEELNEIHHKKINRIRVGLHHTRAGLLLPKVIPAFQKEFPEATIEVYQGNTRSFEAMLVDRRLDLFLGTDTEEQSEFYYNFSQEEPMFLVATSGCLHKYRLDSAISSHKLLATQLSQLPFICNPVGSYFQEKIDKWFNDNNLKLNRKIVITTVQVQLLLAAESLGACFCPKMFMKILANLNQNAIKEENILIPIKVSDCNLSTTLSVITHRDAYWSPILQKFSELFKHELSKSLN